MNIQKIVKRHVKKIWWDRYFQKKYEKELWYDSNGDNHVRKDTHFSFEGKNILVFGGTGGVGEKVVNQFLAAGGRVMVVGRNKKNSRIYFLQRRQLPSLNGIWMQTQIINVKLLT